MTEETVAIVGASKDRSKHGNKAVRAYVNRGWTVYPVNPKESEIEGLKCFPSILNVPRPVQRVSMYLPPQIGVQVLGDIATVAPGEVYFNPGSDSPEIIEKAMALGLNPIVACSITEIGMSPSKISSQ